MIRQPIKLASILAASLAGLCLASAEPRTLGEAEAKKLLNEEFKAQYTEVAIGKRVLVRDEFKDARGSITQRELRFLEAWQQVGFIRIKVLSSPSQQSGWNALLQSTTGGVISYLEIEPTKMGHAVGGRAPDLLKFPTSDHLVERIVRNEYIRSKAEDYRVVYFSYSETPKPYFAEYVKALGFPPEPTSRNKGRWLFKYDPFTDQWKTIADARDFASGDKDFDSNFVSGWLSK